MVSSHIARIVLRLHTYIVEEMNNRTHVDVMMNEALEQEQLALPLFKSSAVMTYAQHTHVRTAQHIT